MNNVGFRAQLFAATASAAMVAATPALAQDEGSQEQASQSEAPGDVIVVTGFRQSLENALNAKRRSGNISDHISAEDIGKSADQNIAEALQRVTGVAIDREDGEGTSITVRGVNGSLNVVTLNGVPVTSSGDAQNVNFSEFSADILSSIEVQKTPSASTDEGSLGAVVKLRTFRPLDSRKNRRVVELQGRHNELGGNDDYKLQVAFSQKFANDTIGLSLVASSERDETRRDEVFFNRWSTMRPPFGATNAETGEIVTSFDYDGDGVEEPLELRTAFNFGFAEHLVSRDRDSYTGTLQVKPWGGSNFQLDVTYTDQTIDRDQRFIQGTSDRANVDANNVVFDPNTFTVIRNVKTAFTNDEIRALPNFTGNPTGRARNVGVSRVLRNINVDRRETFVINGLYEQEFGDFELSLRGGHSETDATPEFNLRGFFRLRTIGQQGTGVQTGYDCAPGGSELSCSFVQTPGLVDDPSAYEFQTFANSGRFSVDEADNFYADLVWNADIGPIIAVSTGFKWTNRSKTVNSTFSSCNRGCVGGELNPFSLADFTDGSQSASDFGEALGVPRDEFSDGFPIWDSATTLAFLQDLGVADRIDVVFSPLGESFIEEEVMAGYLQADFELGGGRIFGDVGIRYQETDILGTAAAGLRYDGFQTFQTEENLAFFGSPEAIADALGPLLQANSGNNAETAAIIANDRHSYNNWLPSLNVNWFVADDMILRFAASKTIARPRFNLLAPGFRINENLFGPFSFGNIGATQLEPFKSRNIDLSFEWYFSSSSLFSFALFDKKFTDFEERQQFTSYWRDVRSEFFDVSQIVDPVTDRAPGLTADQITFNPTPASVLIPIGAGGNVAGCMPNRELDLGSPDSADVCDIALISTRRNGSGGFVRGIETSLQHNFDNLPGLLGGLGFVVNYTFADSELDEETLFNPDGTVSEFLPAFPLEGTSKHTFNTTVFWEKRGNLIRLAYNYRTDYLTNRVVNDFGAHWIEGYGSLDLSANVKLSDFATINFQAVNLLDAVTRTYSTNRPDINSNLPAESSELGSQPSFRTVNLTNTGAKFRLGLRLTF